MNHRKKAGIREKKSVKKNSQICVKVITGTIVQEMNLSRFKFILILLIVLVLVIGFLKTG
ncbi:MAG: hypothetical protein DWQ10_07765 [Calditrichaeota bacterium]|nr:MAG: hypothetical protein DWQ10_07765 [Calditrichota bacterium]